MKQVKGRRQARHSNALPYVVYDVFTGTAFAGNPLAVVFDADGLDSAAMEAIAREFNLSETVFVLSADKPAHAARIRIFTPQRELPFAGHPTVGAAVALAHRGNGKAGHDLDAVLVLEETIGDVRCAVRLENGGADETRNRSGFAEFDLPQLAEPIACRLRKEEVALALGIGAQQIGFENHAISAWSAGVPYVMIPVHDRAVAEKCRCDAARWEALTPIHKGHLASVFIYCRGGVDHAADFHARMFAPEAGIIEDPATGSAVAALSGAIHEYDGMLDGHHAIVVEQGVEMGRPSKISLHMDIAKGMIVRARIGGQAIRVAEGTLLL